LFSAIRQCGVIGAAEDDQVEWMDDTIRFLAERYPELSPTELEVAPSALWVAVPKGVRSPLFRH